MIGVILTDILASIFLLGGLFFMLVGAIGIVRMPDAYNRLHASTKCSTLGLLGLLVGTILFVGTLGMTTKALLTLVFAFVATPVGSHILAKAAHIDGLRQWSRTLSDELGEDYPDREQRDEADLDRDQALFLFRGRSESLINTAQDVNDPIKHATEDGPSKDSSEKIESVTSAGVTDSCTA